MAVSSTPSQLRALAALISSSVESIISEYDANGETMPTLESLEEGPFDGYKKSNINIRRSLQTIEGAYTQLLVLAAPPAHVHVQSAFGFAEASTLRAITDAKVADILADKPEGLHINEIAKISGYDADKLKRIMQFLAAKHTFREVSPNVYANNRLSVYFKSSHPFSGAIGHLADECMKAWAYLPEALADPEWGHSTDPSKTPFSKVFGKALFEWYKENPDIFVRFNRAMTGSVAMRGKDTLLQALPWSSFPDGTTFCDVGGGVGHQARQLLTAFPNLKGIVQDLPSVIEDGKEFWKKTDPAIVESGKFSLLPLDFFAQTPVKEADIYYLASVLHDWPDDKCTLILDNVRKVMQPGNILVIADVTLYDAETFSSGVIQNRAPEPLLPHWGGGSARSYAVDLHMMTLANGRERTVKNMVDLVSKSGFKFKSFFDGVDIGITQFVVE